MAPSTKTRRRSLPVVQAKKPRTSCTCPSCVRCCTNVPGWFTPRDVKRLIERYPRKWPKLVAFDRWYNEDADDTRITVMAPPNKVTKAGEFYPEEGGWAWLGSRRQGACTLLVKGRCSIHSHKSHECRHTFGEGDDKCTGHSDPRKKAQERTLRYRIARAWDRPAGRRFVAAVQTRLREMAK